MTEVYLSELKAGDCVIVQSIDLYDSLSRRLQDLGFVPNGSIRCAYIAPSGSPIAFWVKGALIALRKDDCQKIRSVRCCE